MLPRCSHSVASRWLPGRFGLLTACACSRAFAIWPATDMSGLLLAQKRMRRNEEADREERKDERIEPEIGIAQSFGEGADADRLKPGRWKHQADQPSLAGESGHRHQQTRKVHCGNDAEDRGRKNCG